MRRFGTQLATRRALAATFLLGATIPPAVLCRAQTPPNSASASALSPSPTELVRFAAANEIAANADNSAHHMFRSRKQTPHGSQTRLYVETRDAMVGMTIAYNDQPLTQDQMAGEQGRLQHLIDNPGQLQHKHSQEKEDADHTRSILRALPEAFVYESDGVVEGTSNVGKPGSQLIRLKFHPRPGYTPPSRVEMVLTAMQGAILIDRDAKRIAKIDGTLFKDVPFGWGILGHLDKGGSFLVDQAETNDGTWEVSHMSLRFTGKILFVKGLNITSDEVYSDFRRVPSDLTFAQGVQMLKQEVANLSRDHTAEALNKNAH